MRSDWLLDELGHAGPEHLDPAFVAGYDRKQGFPDAADDVAVLAAHGLSSEALVVDLGAGTGQFTLPAARAFGGIVAVDVSPVMLGVVRSRAAEQRLHNVTCVRAGFLTYEHKAAPADAVHTRNALHHLPDFWKGIALERIASMLRPGGLLRVHDLIYDFEPSEAAAVFADWFEGAAEDPAAGYTAEDYAEHIRTEYSTYRWLFEAMLERAGFAIESAEYGGRVYGAYTCVRR